MAQIPAYENAIIEKLFQMKEGYVMDFTNSSISQFIGTSISRNIYDAKYADGNSGSKANRLRKLFQVEPDRIVGKLLNDLADYYKAISSDTNFNEAGFQTLKSLADSLQQFPIKMEESLVPVAEYLGDQEYYSLVLAEIKDSLTRNQSEACIDRVHTFISGLARQLCEKHELKYENNQTVSKIFNQYFAHVKQCIPDLSEMSIQIMRGTANVIHHFDNVRNTRSLAHPNPLLSKAESNFILTSVSNFLMFVRQLEESMETFVSKDDLPF